MNVTNIRRNQSTLCARIARINARHRGISSDKAILARAAGIINNPSSPLDIVS